MKKLLSLLSVLTISGTAIPATIAASPYQKEETIKNSDINYQQTNNLKTLNRVKRANDNKLDNPSKSYWDIKISHDTWASIAFQHDNKSNEEFKNSLFFTINSLPKIVNFSTDEIYIIVNFINEHYDFINNVYKNKNNNNRGLLIKTDSGGRWYSEDSDWWHYEYYGVFPNKWEYEGGTWVWKNY